MLGNKDAVSVSDSVSDSDNVNVNVNVNDNDNVNVNVNDHVNVNVNDQVARRTRRAIGVFYFAYLGALGLFAPYFGLYLRSLGMSEGAAARLYGIVPAMGLLSPPLVGLLADARRARPHLLRAGSSLAALMFALLLVAPPRWEVIACIVALYALLRAPLTPLVDAAAVDAVSGGMGFGRLRLWGSAGFLVAV